MFEVHAQLTLSTRTTPVHFTHPVTTGLDGPSTVETSKSWRRKMDESQNSAKGLSGFCRAGSWL